MVANRLEDGHLQTNPLEEYIGSGYYLRDVVKNYLNCFEEVLDEAKSHFDRDLVWKRLLQNDLGSATEFSKLFLETLRDNIKDAVSPSDASLCKFLLMKLPWVDVFRSISATLSENSRMIRDEEGVFIGLFIFSSMELDSVLYLTLVDENCVIRLICRDGSQDLCGSDIITTVVNLMVAYVWSCGSI